MAARTAGLRPPSRVVDALHVTALCAFAVAQPVFDLLGRNATFFVAHRAQGADLLWFALGLLLIPPLAIILAEILLRLISEQVRKYFHTAIVGALASMALTPSIVRSAQLSWPVASVVAIILGGVTAAFYSGWRPFRDVISFLSPSPILFLGLFLFWSPVRPLLLGSSVSSSAVSRSNGTSMVVVVFDEFPLASLLSPTGDLNRDRFPGFARLADTSTWYRDATTNVRTTGLSIPTLLSGQFPDWGDIPHHSQRPNNLFTIFSDTHRMNVYEIVSRLCPEETCPEESRQPTSASLYEDATLAYLHLLLPPDVASRALPSLAGRWSGFAGSPTQPSVSMTTTKFDHTRAKRDLNTNLEAKVSEFISRVPNDSTPVLSYIHLMVPHLPWRLLPNGTAYNDPSVTGLDRANRRWSDDGYLVDHARQRHLLQAQYADTLLKQILGNLEQKDSFDESLVIITSDHGANFSPGHSHRDTSGNLAADVLRVPLFIKFPGQLAPLTDHRPAELVDVLPTITDVLNLDVRGKLDGTSLRGNPRTADAPRRLITPAGVVELGSLDIDLSLSHSVAQSTALFGDGRHPDDLFAWGPFSDLVGRSTPTLNVGEPIRDVEVRLQNPQLLADVDLESGFLPARALGTIHGLKEKGRHVAVALNGTIAGLGRTYGEDGSNRFSVILAPRYFRSGSNSVELFLLSPNGAARPLGRKDSGSYAVDVGQAGLKSVSTPNQGTIPILMQSRFKGDVNERLAEHGAITIRGWAADVEGGRTPTAILAVAGDRVVLATDTLRARQDVVDSFGDSRLLMSGFDLVIPRTGGLLTLVVVYEGDASLLELGRLADQLIK